MPLAGGAQTHQKADRTLRNSVLYYCRNDRRIEKRDCLQCVIHGEIRAQQELASPAAAWLGSASPADLRVMVGEEIEEVGMPWAKTLLESGQKLLNISVGETLDPLNDRAGALDVARGEQPGNRPRRIGLQLQI